MIVNRAGHPVGALQIKNGACEMGDDSRFDRRAT
jgi:hypothetical protein